MSLETKIVLPYTAIVFTIYIRQKRHDTGINNEAQFLYCLESLFIQFSTIFRTVSLIYIMFIMADNQAKFDISCLSSAKARKFICLGFFSHFIVFL